MAYLDYNATAPLRAEAKDAMAEAMSVCGNASSVHAAGRAARAVIDRARAQVAALAGAREGEIVFTGGGTEANALALCGAVQGAADAGARITRLFVCAIEHESVRANALELAERFAGLRLEFVPVTAEGVVDLAALRDMLCAGKGRALVALMAANNETGVVQPVTAAAALAQEAGALLFVDAVQAAGKIALQFTDIGADYLSLSAHKLGGPQGAGALIVRASAPFAPMILGGGQENGRRAGTENLVGIAGFGAACSAATPADGALRDRFEAGLKHFAPEAVIFGAGGPRLANTSNFAIPDIFAETALMALDLDGVMLSSGSACSSGTVKPSHVLKAMGISEEMSRCALRASFGWNSSDADVDAALSSLSGLLTRVRARAAA